MIFSRFTRPVPIACLAGLMLSSCATPPTKALIKKSLASASTGQESQCEAQTTIVARYRISGIADGQERSIIIHSTRQPHANYATDTISCYMLADGKEQLVGTITEGDLQSSYAASFPGGILWPGNATLTEANGIITIEKQADGIHADPAYRVRFPCVTDMKGFRLQGHPEQITLRQ